MRYEPDVAAYWDKLGLEERVNLMMRTGISRYAALNTRESVYLNWRSVYIKRRLRPLIKEILNDKAKIARVC
jgi:hypothetical protein